MNKSYLITIFFLILFAGCGNVKEKRKQIFVKNNLDRDRALETVMVALDSLEMVEGKTLKLSYAETNEQIVSQTIDMDGDGDMDAVLFQPQVKANSEAVINLDWSDEETVMDSIPACYSRFVPERTDDYAWENNRVAFRTYGPTAQKMKEEGVPGGTLSSGMDAWLKRVDYPIINSWYQKETSGAGSYHEDTGEGLDNFHVGVSRGVGGIAVKSDSVYHFSKNFTDWQTLYNGPIRTSFVLEYANWDADGNEISETKHISLDYGSNLSRFVVRVEGTDAISAGLTLHENDGTVKVNEENGWVSYWQPHGDSELGTGIVVPEDGMIGAEHYVTDRTDESNLFAHIDIDDDSEAVYYTGFGWKKSGQFETKAQWEDYLARFAEQLKNPLIVTVRR